MRKENVVDGLSMQQTSKIKRTKVKKNGLQHTPPEKPACETKFCKDCVSYTKPMCRDKQEYTPRKTSCTKWLISKKASTNATNVSISAKANLISKEDALENMS